METILNILIIWSTAEIGSGVFHFAEDRYASIEWANSKNKFVRWIGEYIAVPNHLHHFRPAAMLEGNYWSRNMGTILAGLFFAACFWWYWPICVGFLLMTQANQIHGWAHQKSNKLVRFFQHFGILQSPSHHKIHHVRPYNTNYCVMTSYMNPILNSIKFWTILEYLIWICSFGKIWPLKQREIY